MPNSWNAPLCGCFYLVPRQWGGADTKYLPQVDLLSHTTVFSTTSRTKLTQTFINPSTTDKLDEVRYMFPLYDGVSVVGFKCTVADRVIEGVVKEKQQARKDYKEAVDRGETAGLLEQCPDAADCFTTQIGNVPAGKKVIVEIVYVGELKNDAETDGIRFTIPTAIAPRYGSSATDFAGLPEKSATATDKQGINILVDITVEDGVSIRGVQSPSHPVALTMGRTTSMAEDSFDNQHASVSLSLGNTDLGKDFVVVIAAKGHDTPRAILEQHPSIPNQRALMTTLVPRFNLPQEHPEIVFLADRSGSMGGKIPTLMSALKNFLKSLPLGVKFNLCSFGSHFSYLWPKSKTYDESSLAAALAHVEGFDSNFGGTEMLKPIKDVVKNRFRDLNLEVIVATDGEIWEQDELFQFINGATTKSVRFFSLGIGSGASSSLVEGIARAGDGFAQFVGENEKMEKKVVKMLKGALTPHIKDYTIEVKYDKADDDYDIVESVTESLKILGRPSRNSESNQGAGSKVRQKVISLFDTSTKVDDKVNHDGSKYDHLPLIDVPKLLQAPSQVPSLFSFNRTSVYVLMSPHSCQQKPSSVILRATSKQGPLELEIPVQDIGTGETLHQLAAKKAVQELEEGRGWITHAKAGDGKSIKSKHEGRWDDMVEREAVRLGVQFQVGGKWTSFVAVEKNGENGNDAGELPDYEMIQGANVVKGEISDMLLLDPDQLLNCDVPDATTETDHDDCAGPGKPRVHHKSPSTWRSRSSYSTQSIAPARSVGLQQGQYDLRPVVSFGRGPQGSQQQQQQILSSAPAPGGGGNHGLQAQVAGMMVSPTTSTEMRYSDVRQTESTPMNGSTYSTPAGFMSKKRCNVDDDSRSAGPPVADGVSASYVPVASSYGVGDLMRGGQRRNKSVFASKALPAAVPPPPQPSAFRSAAPAADDAKTSAHESAAPPPSPPSTPEDRMHALIALQAFDGAWKWTLQLLNLLEIESDGKQAQIEAAAGWKETDDSILATFCAIAWLEKAMGHEEGVWEMVVEKAREWLGRRIVDGRIDERMDKIKNLL